MFNDDMSEQQQEYEDDKPGTIHNKLNKISIERIKKMGRHWDETYVRSNQ